MKLKILRCPFCGGRTFITELVGDYEEWGSLVLGVQVQCRKCHATGPVVDGSSDLNKQKAIDLWNSIVSLSPKSTEKNAVNYVDSILEEGEEKATDKQLNFANAIASVLDIKLPIEQSKRNLRKFISDNIEKFNKRKPSTRRSYYGEFDDWW